MQQQAGSRSRATLWVVIGVAAAVLVGLLVWALLPPSGPDPEDTPTPATSEPQSPVESTAPEPTDGTDEPTGDTSPDDGDWGPVPPPNVDSLKPLSDPDYPESVGVFVMDEEVSGTGGNTATAYTDPEVIRTISVNTRSGSHHFGETVDNMQDPAVSGNAVCGTTTTDFGEQLECVVAGTEATLWTSTMELDFITLEELADFTNGLHDEL